MGVEAAVLNGTGVASASLAALAIKPKIPRMRVGQFLAAKVINKGRLAEGSNKNCAISFFSTLSFLVSILSYILFGISSTFLAAYTGGLFSNLLFIGCRSFSFKMFGPGLSAALFSVKSACFFVSLLVSVFFS